MPRISNRSSSATPKRSVQLGVECLEERTLMAANLAIAAKLAPPPLQQASKALVAAAVPKTPVTSAKLDTSTPAVALNLSNSAIKVNLAAPASTPLAGTAEQLKARTEQLRFGLDGIQMTAVANLDAVFREAVLKVGEAAQNRFLQDAFGASNVGTSIGSVLDQLRGLGSTHSRNPLAEAYNGMLDQSGWVSEGEDDPSQPAEGKNTQEELGKAAEQFGEVAQAVGVLFAGAALVAGGPPGWLAGIAAGVGFGGALFELGGKAAQATSGKDNDSVKTNGKGGEPIVQDVPTGGPTILTKDQVRGLAGRLGGKGEPVEDPGTGGSGGPVVMPKTTLQGEWVGDNAVQSQVITSAQVKGIVARIEGNITIVK